MPGYTRKRIQQLARNKMEKVLHTPARQQQERQFREEHLMDSDEALLTLLTQQKRKLGDQMKPVNTIGYCYIVERFGAWSVAMREVNQRLLREKQSGEKVPEESVEET